MVEDAMSELEQMKRLAELVRQKNLADGQIAKAIGRPALQGHFGEFMAARIFAIELHGSAVQKDSDGRFVGGPFSGRTVQIKYYPKNEHSLDMKAGGAQDFYLVLTGPRSTAETSHDKTRPWVIEAVYLFDAVSLTRRLTSKVGVATSVRREFWEEAEIYPCNNPAFPLTESQREMLALFSEASVG